MAEHLALGAQQDLGGGLAAAPEPAQHHLHAPDDLVPAALVQLVHDVGGQLVGGVVGPALRLAEPDVARRQGDDRPPVRLRHRDVAVVLVRVHVEVKRLRRRPEVLELLARDALPVRARREVR